MAVKRGRRVSRGVRDRPARRCIAPHPLRPVLIISTCEGKGERTVSSAKGNETRKNDDEESENQGERGPS